MTMSRVFPVLRRLLPALLLACVGLVLVPGAAQAACKCQAASIERSARQADVVLTGVMAGQRRAVLSFEVDRIYKGEVTSGTVDVVTPTNSCGLRLAEDESYLVFATQGRSGLASQQCSGTTAARARVVDDVERALGPGERYRPPQPPPDPEPVPPTYTRLLHEPPPEFVRTAAPGAAIALVGLLGWFLVRRRY